MTGSEQNKTFSFIKSVIISNRRRVTLSITVAPRSSSNSIAGVVDGRLKIKLTSPPVDGKANTKLINYLSKLLKIKKSSIEITQGETSKKKVVAVEGMSEEEIINIISKTL